MQFLVFEYLPGTFAMRGPWYPYLETDKCERKETPTVRNDAAEGHHPSAAVDDPRNGLPI